MDDTSFGKTGWRSMGKRTGEDRILTASNVISLIRLVMILVFFIVYVGYDWVVVGSLVFAVAAATDWLDGHIARTTRTVTKLGKVLDPLIDRLFLIFGVLAIFITGRVPLWVMILIFARDIILGVLTLWMKHAHGNSLTVAYVGKVATACLMVGFCMLLLDWPMVSSLGWFEIGWLPGFGTGPISLGIFFTYVGVVFQWVTAALYLYRGIKFGTTASGCSQPSNRGKAE